MNGVRNADEFLRRFRTAHLNYNEHFLNLVEDVRAKSSNNPTNRVPPAVNGALEAHLREYLINHLLDALNWRLGTTPEQGLPDMVPEAPVASLSEVVGVEFEKLAVHHAPTLHSGYRVR